MPLQLFRKLSMRKRSTNNEDKMRKSSSSKGLLAAASEHPILPPHLTNAIIDCLPFFEQLKLREINHAVNKHVNMKLKQITKLVVSKQPIAEVCRGRSWEHHKHAQVALRLHDDTAHIVVDSRWTSKDVECVVGLMAVFRLNIIEATIDAPIAELVVVSLSLLDLQRWYAFQCIMKINNVFEDDEDEDQHMRIPPAHHDEVYWPVLDALTVRTTERQSAHLARVIDYGVVANNVLNRRKISHIKVVYTDVEQNYKELARKVLQFRCWAGSAGFDHRFEQEFAPKATY